MADRLVIVGCGRHKADGVHPAADLYTGTLFRQARAAARAMSPDRWLVLSALYGLVWPWDKIRGYDLALGEPGAVGPDFVTFQAARLGVLFTSPVTVLASARYAQLCRQVWEPWGTVETPLAHLGIGRQMRELARLAKDPPSD